MAYPLIPTVWSDETVALLKEKAAQGWGGRQIARELGDGFSRSAVISKAIRLGIALNCQTGKWPDEARIFLFDKAADNWTVAEILIGLQQLGYTYTRKQINDVARHHKVKLNRPVIIRKEKPIKTRRQQLIERRVIAAENRCECVVADDPALPASRPVTVRGLERNHCRWPIERNADGDRLFCGAPKFIGSYCVTHYAASIHVVSKRNVHVSQEI